MINIPAKQGKRASDSRFRYLFTLWFLGTSRQTCQERDASTYIGSSRFYLLSLLLTNGHFSVVIRTLKVVTGGLKYSQFTSLHMKTSPRITRSALPRWSLPDAANLKMINLVIFSLEVVFCCSGALCHRAEEQDMRNIVGGESARLTANWPQLISRWPYKCNIWSEHFLSSWTPALTVLQKMFFTKKIS